MAKRRRRLQPVKDWRRGWRWISAWMMGVPATAAGGWVAAPKDWRDVVPPEWLLVGVAVCGLLGLAGRFINQAVLFSGVVVDEEPADGDPGGDPQ